MLKLSKKGVSMSYKVVDAAGAEIAVLRGCGMGQTGTVDIAGSSVAFTPVDEPWTFAMSRDGVMVGTAERTRGRKHFVIDHGGAIVDIDCPHIRNKPYDATMDGQAIGSISLSKFTGRVVTVDLPDAIPLDTRVFIGWLALRTWNAGAEVRIRPS